MNGEACLGFNHEDHRGHEELFGFSPSDIRDLRGDQRSPRARKSSWGSSKLQLPNDATNLRRYCNRSVLIFHSRHMKKSSVNENESAFSSSSIIEVWCAVH